MLAEGYWATKTYRCGKVGEKVKFFVPAGRSHARAKSSAEKIASNANNTIRKAARIVNENFKGGDGFLCMSCDEKRYARILKRAEEKYGELPETDRIRAAAEHELRLCFDRARRELHKQGVELKYFAVTSDMDGDTGELVRVHFHVIVPADCVQVIREKWGGEEYEDPNFPEWKERLWEMDDYTPLVEYMLKQVRHISDAKKYMPSRNLIRSEVKPRKVLSGAPLRVPKGCTLLYAAPYTGERECQYIRYLLPEEEWTGVRKKEKLDPTSAGAGARARATGYEMPKAPPEEIRCPGCGQMLAVRKANGMIEYKARRQTILTERATLCCQKCGRTVEVGKNQNRG